MQLGRSSPRQQRGMTRPKVCCAWWATSTWWACCGCTNGGRQSKSFQGHSRHCGHCKRQSTDSHSFVSTAGQERFYTTEGYDQGTNVLRMVGYFSLVGLLRVHTLVGDYHGALKALGAIHPFQRSHLFTPKIASEQFTRLPIFTALHMIHA